RECGSSYFLLWSGAHGGKGGLLSQAQLRQTDRSEGISLETVSNFLVTTIAGTSLKVPAKISATTGATSTRENCVSFPINGFHRGMRFHFDRARFPSAIDRTGAPGRRRGRRNRR